MPDSTRETSSVKVRRLPEHNLLMLGSTLAFPTYSTDTPVLSSCVLDTPLCGFSQGLCWDCSSQLDVLARYLHCPTAAHFFLSNLRNEEQLICSWTLTRNLRQRLLLVKGAVPISQRCLTHCSPQFISSKLILPDILNHRTSLLPNFTEYRVLHRQLGYFSS